MAWAGTSWPRGTFSPWVSEMENKLYLKSPGKDPKASSAHSPGRSVPGLMRQTLVPVKCRITAEFRAMFFWDLIQNIKTNPTTGVSGFKGILTPPLALDRMVQS